MIRKVKRSLFVFLWIEEGPVFDLSGFLQGELKASKKPKLLALSLLTESKVPIDLDSLRLLADLPADSWSTALEVLFRSPNLDDLHLQDLARKGLLLTDSEDPELARLRQRNQHLSKGPWHPFAACYHFMTREREKNAPFPWAVVPRTEDLARTAAEDAAGFVERYGPPPPAFHRAPEASQTIPLPLFDPPGDLFDLLERRKSTRAFATDQPLPLKALTTLLRYVFGCQGYYQPVPEITLLHKTSPSGGALHPIEAYPLILNVESLDPGFYHYRADDHSLELVHQLTVAEGRHLALEISGGQTHAQAAHVLVALTARFSRYFWKYRGRSQAYGALLMDVGHLGQTFSLVATELGLGTFFSAAVDGPRIEDVLRLDAASESALALCACGVKSSASKDDLGLAFRPYTPRGTEL